MIGIIMFQNMRYAPFLKLYENILQEAGLEYEVIYYDRDKSLNEPSDEKYIPIPWYGKGTVAAPKYEKFLNFACYRSHLLKLLKKKQYDRLIILTTFPAVLISGYLKKAYADRYIVDIRDYTQEGFRPYFNMEAVALKHSALNVISSSGFVHFLPKASFVRCHNMAPNVSGADCKPLEKAEDRPIVISYIGSIMYEKQCKQLMDLVNKDDRYAFHFYGNESNGNAVSEYVKQLNCDRIVMHGPFLPHQKEEIYSASDLVFNCYGNDSTLVKYAISNKFYDAPLYGKPLLVSPHTAMAEESGIYACALDLDHLNDLDELFRWYRNLDVTDYNAFAKNVIDSSAAENVQMREAVLHAIK